MKRGKVRQLTSSFIGTVIRVAILIIALLVIYKVGIKAYDFGFRIFTEKPMSPEPGRDVDVMITQSDSIKDIGNMLKEKGLIRDADLFVIQELLMRGKGSIEPGSYTLNTSLTPEEMIAILLKHSTDEEEDGELSAPDPLTDESTSSEPAPLTEAEKLEEGEEAFAGEGDVEESTEENPAEAAEGDTGEE